MTDIRKTRNRATFRGIVLGLTDVVLFDENHLYKLVHVSVVFVCMCVCTWAQRKYACVYMCV